MQEDEKIEEYVKEDDFEEKREGNWKEKLFNLIESKYFIPIIIVLIAIISFSLGRISGLQEKREPVRVVSENSGEVKGISTGSSSNNPLNPPYIKREIEQANSSGAVVASKNGTKYHYPWCAGAKQISAKNLITFNSIESARAAGFSPASNCKGLK